MRLLLRLLVLVVVAATTVIGVEIVLALRRDYLPSEPALEVGGTFGPPSGGEVDFLVIGDSTAAGLGADSAGGAYPTLLAERLALDGYRVQLTVLGVSGARVSDVLSEQLPRALEAKPDLVFVGIGANDVTHVTPLGDIRRDMRTMIERLRADGITLVVAGAPDMRAPAFYQPLRALLGWRGRAVTGAIEGVARDEDTAVVELAAKTGPLFAEDPDKYHSEDDFHPSGAGYALWADAIYPVLRAALKEH